MDETEHIESDSRRNHNIGRRIFMNSIKDKLHFVTAVLLLLLIGFTVWYVLFYLQGPEACADGILVYREAGKVVACG